MLKIRTLIEIGSWVTFILLLVSCEKPKDFSSRISEIDRKVDAVNSSLSEVRVQLISQDYKTAYLSPDSDNFTRLDSSIASFFVSISKVSSYADGYKIQLNLGNPNYASFQHVKLNVTWGKRFDLKKYTFQEIQDSKHSKEIALQKSLKPGSWNTTEVIIAPASKDEIGSIMISLDTPSVILSRF